MAKNPLQLADNIIYPQEMNPEETRKQTQQWMDDIKNNKGIISKPMHETIKQSLMSNYGMSPDDAANETYDWANNLGFTFEEEPQLPNALDEEDYNLFESLRAESGHGANWGGYRKEWDDLRNAGFDLPERREGRNFVYDPHTRRVYWYKYDKKGNPNLTPIVRVKK